MKTVLFGFALMLFLIFALTSCASDKVIDPQPPVTQLRSEPVADRNLPKTNPTGSSQVDQDLGKTSSTAQTAPDPKRSFSIGRELRSAASGVAMAASTMPYRIAHWNERDWIWAFLLLIVLFLLASLQQLRARRSQRIEAEKFLAESTSTEEAIGLNHRDILVQAAGVAEDIHLLVKPQTQLKEIIATAAQRGQFGDQESFIFLENEKNPINPHHLIGAFPLQNKAFHVHPQKEIIVSIFFNGRIQKMHFSPAMTVKKVTAWADYRYKEFDPDATGVYLAIKGYFAPLVATAHIGRYVPHHLKHLELDVLTYAREEVKSTT